VSGVFINYRSDDSEAAAALIDRELSASLGSDQVFLDSRSIPAGVDFVEELLGRLRRCSVLLVVIGPRWLTLTDTAGQRRIDDPQDWIRREIAEALSRGLRVIPVLTGGVALPAEADLPPDIAELSRRQYVPLRPRFTAVDLDFLVKQIARVPGATDDPTTPGKAGRTRRRRILLGAVGLAAAAIIPIVVLVQRGPPSGPLHGTIRNTWSPKYGKFVGVYGYVSPYGTRQSGPGYPEGAKVSVVCSHPGRAETDSANKSSSIWYKLVDGNWIPSLYFLADSSGDRSLDSIPVCKLGRPNPCAGSGHGPLGRSCAGRREQ